MKKLIPVLALLIAFPSFAQKKPVVEIDKMVTRSSVEAPLTFLAADEMRGRDTGSHEIDIAANYIASFFSRWDCKRSPAERDIFNPWLWRRHNRCHRLN